MSALCPNPEQSCDDCIADFIFDHPGVEVWRHTPHAYCECPWIGTPTGGGDDVCVGCRERRDLAAEFRRLMDGMPRRAA